MESSIYKHAKHLRAHTWRDVGGAGGILLDFAFFAFLIVLTSILILFAIIGLTVSYFIYILFAFLSIFRGTKQLSSNEPTIQSIPKMAFPKYHRIDQTVTPDITRDISLAVTKEVPSVLVDSKI